MLNHVDECQTKWCSEPLAGGALVRCVSERNEKQGNPGLRAEKNFVRGEDCCMCTQSLTSVRNEKTYEFIIMDNIQLVCGLMGFSPNKIMRASGPQ